MQTIPWKSRLLIDLPAIPPCDRVHPVLRLRAATSFAVIGFAPVQSPLLTGKEGYGRPAQIGTEALREFDGLPEARGKLIAGALALARESPWLPYRFGGSSPGDGGFDCSGAMHFVLTTAVLHPPRTSADQYLWLRENGRLNEVPAALRSLVHPSLASLQPGDLLIWGGTSTARDGRKPRVTQVALSLGHEKMDGHAVMINATDGRSYRGTKANGYGVYDFRRPRAGSKAAFLGFGTPPGVAAPK